MPMWNKRRPALGVVVALSGAVFIGCLIAMLAMRWRHDRMIARELAYLEAAGFPTALAKAMGVVIPESPCDENGSAAVRSAIDALPRLEAFLQVLEEGNELIWLDGVQLHRSLSEGSPTREWLESGGNVIGFLKEASTCPSSRLSFSSFQGGTYRELLDYSTVAMAVAAHDGDSAVFVDATIGALTVVRMARRYPNERIRRWARRTTAGVLEELERALRRVDFDDEQLHAMEEALAALPNYRDDQNWARMMTLSCTLDAYESYIGWRVGEWKVRRNLRKPRYSSLERVGGMLGGGFYEAFDLGRGEALAQAREWRASLEAFELRPEDIPDYLNRTAAAGDLGAWFYEVVPTPYGPSKLPLLLQSDAEVAATLARVRVERYRLVHGNWPDSLRDLVPEFADDVPIDPFDGTPLTYRKKGAEIVVFSGGGLGR